MDAGEVDKKFRDWTVAKSNDEELLEMLRHLCSEGVPNENVRHRELLRGITINHILMANTIRDLKTTMHNLNASNERTQRFLLVLTVVAVIVGAIQAVAAIVSICR
jgi:hypothetical protein